MFFANSASALFKKCTVLTLYCEALKEQEHLAHLAIWYQASTLRNLNPSSFAFSSTTASNDKMSGPLSSDGLGPNSDAQYYKLQKLLAATHDHLRARGAQTLPAAQA